MFVCVFCFFCSYELAEECADDEDDKAAIRKLRKRVNQKLKAHDTLVRVSFAFVLFTFLFFIRFRFFNLCLSILF